MKCHQFHYSYFFSLAWQMLLTAHKAWVGSAVVINFRFSKNISERRERDQTALSPTGVFRSPFVFPFLMFVKLPNKSDLNLCFHVLAASPRDRWQTLEPSPQRPPRGRSEVSTKAEAHLSVSWEAAPEPPCSEVASIALLAVCRALSQPWVSGTRFCPLTEQAQDVESFPYLINLISYNSDSSSVEISALTPATDGKCYYPSTFAPLESHTTSVTAKR